MPSKYLEASIRIVVGQEWTDGWRALAQHLEQVRVVLVGSLPSPQPILCFDFPLRLQLFFTAPPGTGYA